MPWSFQAVKGLSSMLAPKILLEGDPRLDAFPQSPANDSGGAVVVGWREWAGLPSFGIARIKAKLDTGARTSALHANSIESFEAAGVLWVRFDVTGEGADVPLHEARILDRRMVRSSNGGSETRFVIRTELMLAGRSWQAEMTLTNRDRMDLPMLIGREALAGRALVDAEKSWLWGRPGLANAGRRKRRPPQPRPAQPGDSR